MRSFKIGPDFIDPGYHREITGRPSINLDVWMMGVAGVRRAFRRWSQDAEVSVVEAMGGLYDGMNGTGRGSAAHVAKTLGLPVVVVLDVWGMTGTTGAILEGLRSFDRGVRIAGCILNRVGSRTHADMIVDALPRRLKPLVLGAITQDQSLAVQERHLGLVTVDENRASERDRGLAQDEAGAELDIERLLTVTRGGAAVESASVKLGRLRGQPRVRLAVARDAAFCFYYEENLVALREAGFELVSFSPVRGDGLPDGTDAVYLGGGYPERFAVELGANRGLARQLRERAQEGMPVYAECGGMMYLARSLTGFDGVRHRMAGVLPIDVAMDSGYLSIHYVRVRTRVASPFGDGGVEALGQEFHQSRVTAADVEPNLFDVSTSTGASYRAGYLVGNVAASYVHLHLAGRSRMLRQWVRCAEGAGRGVSG